MSRNHCTAAFQLFSLVALLALAAVCLIGGR
jgi:hypothetical protein